MSFKAGCNSFKKEVFYMYIEAVGVAHKLAFRHSKTKVALFG